MAKPVNTGFLTLKLKNYIMQGSWLNRLDCVLEPVFINTLEFAEQSLEIHGRIFVSNLPRLQDVLFSDRGEIEYRLAGGRSSRGKYALYLKISGSLMLVCQRCLDGLAYPIHIERRFELIRDESALPDSDLNDDEVDYLAIEPRLNVADLVEEEILLSLPMSLRHDGDCSSGTMTPQGRASNPFRVLEGLKANKEN